MIGRVILFTAKKVAKIDPQDFITQDNVSTAIKLATHVIKLLF